MAPPRPLSGRARYVGVSNDGGWQSARAASLMKRAPVPLISNEIEYSLLVRDAGEKSFPPPRRSDSVCWPVRWVEAC